MNAAIIRVEHVRCGDEAMGTITINFPKEVADLLGNSPEEVKQRVHEILVLSFYREHKISSGRAAELLGMELLSFIEWSGALGVPYINMTPEEWQQDIRTIEDLDRPDSRS